ncbi:MAG: phosphoenolpyruvate--protein phosphotransferase, partial [Candidatus Wallbacteria bacterium]|nr:phosphoenolpyruvate--protein phosphotransferase [Candidatus Wallbacteria bacterium]
FREKEHSAKSESLTRDGCRVLISANIEREDEAVMARDCGAQGIGLYRTEYLFAEYQHLPSEEEQYDSYRKVLKAFDGEATIIRTFDLGGDKQFFRFRKIEEENPFLGFRGIRISLRHEQLFRTQLRALYRASVFGNLHVLFPMINSCEEIQRILDIIGEVKDQLRQERMKYSDHVKLGVLIETPASSFLIDDFSRQVDFFSIGTNDLLQFILAVDRNNPYISDSYNVFHPAIFRSISKIVDRVHQNGRWVSICGEMASNPLVTPVLLGFGITRLSLSPPLIPRIKKVIRGMNLSGARILADKIMRLSKSDEIRKLLEDFQRKCIIDREVADEVPPLRC